jgi:hypothetical protein
LNRSQYFSVSGLPLENRGDKTPSLIFVELYGRFMSVATYKRRFQAILACLLILCLSPATLPAQWLFGVDKPGDSSEAVLYTPNFSDSEAPLLVSESPNRLNGFNGQIKAAIIPRQPPIFSARIFSPYLFNKDAIVSKHTGRSAIPVRAPPLHRFC